MVRPVFSGDPLLLGAETLVFLPGGASSKSRTVVGTCKRLMGTSSGLGSALALWEM